MSALKPRATGLGGVFFKAKDPAMRREWYRKHLGIDVQEWGGAVFFWASPANPTGAGHSVWSIMESTTKYYEPSQSSFMINYRVADLQSLIEVLKSEGCDVSEKTDDSEFGKFAWVMDPEGNRCELWQPPEGQ